MDQFASTGQGFLGYNMFAYCGNNPVLFSDYSGNRRSAVGSFDSDSVGRELLWHYLFGDGEDFPSTEKHSQYLMDNELLKHQVRSYVFKCSEYIRPGEKILVDTSINVVIENGESIIGYQYLHGTNSDVGGFQIQGVISRDLDGLVTYDLTYTWNDIMDPNMYYDSDRVKAKFAEIISFGRAQSYQLSISWSDKSTASYSPDPCSSGGTGWLFS